MQMGMLQWVEGMEHGDMGNGTFDDVGGVGYSNRCMVLSLMKILLRALSNLPFHSPSSAWQIKPICDTGRP